MTKDTIEAIYYIAQHIANISIQLWAHTDDEQIDEWTGQLSSYAADLMNLAKQVEKPGDTPTPPPSR